MPTFFDDKALDPAEPLRARRTAVEPGANAKDRPTAPGAGVRQASTVLGLQRSVGNAGTTAYLQRQEEHEERSPVHDTIASGGAPLDHGTRTAMEQHLGADFSDVRLHVDRNSAESVHAAAYTVGNNVVVNPDHFQAGTPAAQRTLAHELTHVVQQRSGPVDGTPAEGGIRVSDPSDRFEREAERSADAMMSGQGSAVHAPAAAATAGASAAPGVQREAAEEESVQALSLQREEEEEKEGEEG